MTMHVDIVSAEQQIFSGTAEMVFAPSVNGDVGVLPRHAPLLTQMRPGEVRIQTSEGEETFYVSSGILEIQPHCVTVLADTALRAKDIDEAAALEAKQLAEEAMTDRKGGIDYTKAQSQLAEAMAQLKAIQKIRDKTGH